MPAIPDISIIVPSWNNLQMLRLCVRSVRQHSELDFQLVVHANEATDGTLQWLRDEGIDFTYSEQNLGICRSLNAAFEKTRADYLVYLNDDMYVLPSWDRQLYDRTQVHADREPCYVSGTMVQNVPISPVAVAADYGNSPRLFDEQRLLRDYRSGQLSCRDWNGATWPPSCIHRKWWQLAGGYSEEFPFGFYSDIDFSMKLWQVGCRRFYGLGGSLAYHFGETTTSKVRGSRSRNVQAARIRFLRKWGVLPSTFNRYFLRVHEPELDLLPESSLENATWERARLRLLRIFHGVDRAQAVA